MRLHGGPKLWASEIQSGFRLIKDVFLGVYRRLMRIRVFGVEFWKQVHRNAIVVTNHLTGADSLILQIALRRRLFMLAARKWFSSRLVDFFMTLFCDMVPVALEQGARNLLGIKRSLALLKRNQSLGIFPSGELNRDGSIPEINPGAAYLSVKSGTPIVPVYLKNLTLGPEPGSRPWLTAAWEGFFSIVVNIFNRRIEAYIGKPIYPSHTNGKIHEEIERMNAEIRTSFDRLQHQARMTA
ncbi:1-acyl-sn-glycerol-3-phosphate acyltransferase [candidate division WOR-3 bacterium]|nr:1-acyl-sn-glycerol-3-phosphate acyltransferase [candidate division WOR-3 bacterium]